MYFHAQFCLFHWRNIQRKTLWQLGSAHLGRTLCLFILQGSIYIYVYVYTYTFWMHLLAFKCSVFILFMWFKSQEITFSSTKSNWSWAKCNLILVKLLQCKQRTTCVPTCLELSFIVCCRGVYRVHFAQRYTILTKSLTHTHLSLRYHVLVTYHVGTMVTPNPENMKWRPSGERDNVSLRRWKFAFIIKDCEDLREVACLKPTSSLERNIQVPWSRFGINWCQIWHSKVKAAISLLPRNVSTFGSLHAYYLLSYSACLHVQFKVFLFNIKCHCVFKDRIMVRSWRVFLY